MYVRMYVWPSHVVDWAATGMVINPARGVMSRGLEIPLSPFAPENFVWTRVSMMFGLREST